MKSHLKFSALLFVFAGILGMSVSKKVEIFPKATNSFAVVQLFTSQGCSSCPKADDLLAEIKQDKSLDNVYVLSYHVDYWNRLGWKDPFSSKKNTDLQNNYSAQFKNEKVFTPQAVINGKVEFVGSDSSKMRDAIKNATSSISANEIIFSDVDLREKEVRVHYVVNGDVEDKQIVMNLVLDSRSTKIDKGENNGKTLKNINVVIQDFALPLMKNEGIVVINIPDLVTASDKLSVIGFVQKSDLSITGASSINVN